MFGFDLSLRPQYLQLPTKSINLLMVDDQAEFPSEGKGQLSVATSLLLLPESTAAATL
jgi:hypothetical protein